MAIQFAITIFLTILALVNAFDCTISKWSNQKFDGKLGVSDWAADEVECTNRCWDYNEKNAPSGYPCKSVNYVAATKSCQFFLNDLDDRSTSLKSDPSTSYIIVHSCQKTTQTGNTSAIGQGTCGQSSVPLRVNGLRVVGGYEARQNSVPFIVSLRSNGFHFCGGTLIRVSPNREESDIVITASHCMGWSPGFDVVAGAHYKQTAVDGQQTAKAEKILTHPNYHNPITYANDIAIVKLDRPIKFTKTVQPACLPASASEDPSAGSKVFVSGWGATERGDLDALMQAQVPVIGSDRCIQLYKEINPQYRIDPPSMICASSDRGDQGACFGDSGGPLFMQGRNGYTLVGAVSWGAGCLPNTQTGPAVYARVSTFLDWIQKEVKNLSSIRD